jgi:NDP-sugar pyrophosphorylase family protein
MLLAAGLGSRLQPLTDLRPKPIVPVANKPLGAFAMEHLARQGVRTIVANTHPRPHEVEFALKTACPRDVDLRFSREATLLGTGGGLRKARPLFDDSRDSVIVMNADTLFTPDLRRACLEHTTRGAVATMILRRTADPRRFGAIGIDGNGWVRRLLGEPENASITEELMFTGVHILRPEAFEALPQSGCVIRTAYRHWIDRGVPVLGIVDQAPWADLGTISEYHRLNLDLASGTFVWPGIVAENGSILASSIEEPGRVRHSVIGEDVRLDEGVTLDRCVVWAGTQVGRSASNAVLTPVHRLEVSSAP